MHPHTHTHTPHPPSATRKAALATPLHMWSVRVRSHSAGGAHVRGPAADHSGSCLDDGGCTSACTARHRHRHPPPPPPRSHHHITPSRPPSRAPQLRGSPPAGLSTWGSVDVQGARVGEWRGSRQEARACADGCRGGDGWVRGWLAGGPPPWMHGSTPPRPCHAASSPPDPPTHPSRSPRSAVLQIRSRGGAQWITSWGKFWLAVLGVYSWDGGCCHRGGRAATGA